ncbi:MAG: 2-dehydro-3-deoxy-6-phosphogalactonate aldolase [Caulobacteraceae bacterium]
MSAAAFRAAMARRPLVAILRGVEPGEVEAIGEALVDAGFTLIEVPLNSPEPFESLERLARRLGDRAVVGAGTVLAVADVARVKDAGGAMVVSPNTDPAVIGAVVAAGMACLPGFLTPGEAFAALAAGATAVKLFPAEASSPAALGAMRAVLPKAALLLPVGGITPGAMAPWRAAGADGFGLGGALYRKGDAAADVARAARAFIHALEQEPP